MTPTAISQLIEAALRLTVGLGAAEFCLRRGMALEWVAAGAISGVTAGSLLGTLYFLVHGRRRGNPPWSRKIAGELLRISVPVMLGSAVMSLTTLMDNFLVIRLLEASGASASYANARYGIYSTMAVSLAALPQSLIGSLSVSLIPGIAGAWSAGDRTAAREQAQEALLLSGTLAIPCAVGMATLAQPLLELLFSADGAEAAPLLRLLTPGFLAICTATVTGAMLQAAGQELRPVRSMAWGAAVKLAASLWLIPRMGIAGAPVSTSLCYGVIALGNLHALHRMGLLPGLGGLWKPAAAATAMLLPIAICGTWLPDSRIGTLALTALCAVVYGAVLYALGGVPGKYKRMCAVGEKPLAERGKI